MEGMARVIDSAVVYPHPSGPLAKHALRFLTQQLRRLSKPLAASIPKGAVIGSHSWREMAAVSCYLAWFDSLHMANHGFWRDPATMWSSYIRPYKDVFPYSQFIAAVFDFLRGV